MLPLKPYTSSPDCCVSLVIFASSCRSPSSVPGAAGLHLALCYSDPDITTNQAHVQVPKICVDVGRGQGRKYYNNQPNSE